MFGSDAGNCTGSGQRLRGAVTTAELLPLGTGAVAHRLVRDRSAQLPQRSAIVGGATASLDRTIH